MVCGMSFRGGLQPWNAHLQTVACRHSDFGGFAERTVKKLRARLNKKVPQPRTESPSWGTGDGTRVQEELWAASNIWYGSPHCSLIPYPGPWTAVNWPEGQTLSRISYSGPVFGVSSFWPIGQYCHLHPTR